MPKRKYTKRQSGGSEHASETNESTNNKKEDKGYIDALKQKLSVKVGNLVNRLVTKQVENKLLRCLPPQVKNDVQSNIEGTIQNMVTDISEKSLDTGENILKAAPAVGNVFSALSAADSLLAGIKNTKNSVFEIKKEIDKF